MKSARPGLAHIACSSVEASPAMAAGQFEEAGIESPRPTSAVIEC